MNDEWNKGGPLRKRAVFVLKMARPGLLRRKNLRAEKTCGR